MWLIDASDRGEHVEMTQWYAKSTNHPIEAKTVPRAMKATRRWIIPF
jgi:hypothetical protein